MDNTALLQRLSELGVTQAYGIFPATEVQDHLSWVSYFLAFVAAKVDSKETQELAVYGQITIHLARKHGGKGWLSYDHLSRQQVAAGSLIPWAELNPSLMAATVLGSMGPG